MKAIVNVNEEWGIGKGGELLLSIPEDMQFFRNETKGKVVVYGCKTLLGFPGKKPLKGRINVVLTTDLSHIPGEAIEACDCYFDAVSQKNIENFGKEGTTTLIGCTSVTEARDILCIFESDNVYLCGGASLYKELLPWCDCCLVTKNNCTEKADRFFPDLDSDPSWECVSEGETKEYKDISYRFTVYRRKP